MITWLRWLAQWPLFIGFIRGLWCSQGSVDFVSCSCCWLQSTKYFCFMIAHRWQPVWCAWIGVCVCVLDLEHSIEHHFWCHIISARSRRSLLTLWSLSQWNIIESVANGLFNAPMPIQFSKSKQQVYINLLTNLTNCLDNH